MAIVNKSSSVQGKWLDKKTLVTGDRIKIVTEALEQPAPQGDNMQLVAKVLVKGRSDSENLAINIPSKNALIDAFGKDTKDWVDKVLTANVEKVLVAGKRGIALYLIPEGMVLKESDDGFLYVGHPESESGTVKNLGVSSGTIRKSSQLRIEEENGAPVDRYPGKFISAEEQAISPEDIPFD